MKKVQLYLCLFTMMAMLFASCSKEEDVIPKNSETTSLTFGAIVNDLVDRAAQKQEGNIEDLPDCSDLAPAYVEVILTDDGSAVVGSTGDPFRIDLVDGQVFTEDVPELELVPGEYTLEHFAVFSSNGTLIWLAPVEGSILAEFVDRTLPIIIDLKAGVKKYVEVPVICYDNRDVNEYGYLFFEFETGEIIEFCIFGNFCPPNGRHYPARFSVDVWLWDGEETGALIHSDITNTVELNEDGDYAGTTVCVALPDLEGTDEYYFEITLLDSDAYGNVENRIIRTGVISDVEVREFFSGEDEMEYFHFKEGPGCENEDTPPIFDEPGDDSQSYKACLTPLNDSGALAFAYFQLEGNSLRATVLATGLEPNKQHAQHIHGIDGENAVCPPESASGDDDIITIGEGLPFYGGVKLALTEEGGDFPTANADGDYIYNRTFTLGGETISAAALGPLQDRAVVVHGMTLDGTYVGSLPVACAEIMEQE